MAAVGVAGTAASEIAGGLLERWREDPVLFAIEALGLERVWSRQEEFLRAVATHRKVAVRSGQKTSKTLSIACLAIWWALTRPRASVTLLAPSQRQIREQMWVELAKLRDDSYDRSRTPRALMPLGGDFHESPEGGWRFPNRSKIIGAVTNDPERLRGFSGADQLYIIDEASGVPDTIFASIDGNVSGGGSIVAVSNPVHADGWYARCFGDKSRWKQIHMSSIEASQLDPPIRGLALPEFIEEKREDWGTNSAEWYAKILGEFPPEGADGVIARAILKKAAARWTERPPDRSARLNLGIDVARFGNDRSSLSWARGQWVSRPLLKKGCDVVEIAECAVEIIEAERHKRNGEKALVKVDTVSVGGGVADILRRRTDICEVVDIQAAESSPDPRCSRMRDAVWIFKREWLSGGAIPDDNELIEDLATPRLGYDGVGKWKVESKLEVRRRIGRSTDQGDSSGLAVYQPPTEAATWDPMIVERTHRRG